MPRINNIGLDTDVTKDDKLLGSDSGGSTKSYTLKNISTFLKETNSAGVPTQITYKYDTGVGQNPGYLDSPSVTNFETASARTVRISVVGHGDMTSTRADFIQALLNREIIIANVNDLNNFGIFLVTNIANSTDADGNAYKTLTLASPVAGKGSFINKEIYALGAFPSTGDLTAVQTTTSNQLTITNGTGPIPSLAIVTGAVSNNGNGLSTQAQIKAYVDSQVDTVDTLSEVLALGNTTGGTKIEVNNTSGGIDFIDNAELRFGTGGDLKIYYDGGSNNHSYISHEGTGVLNIRSTTDDVSISAPNNKGVYLYVGGQNGIRTFHGGASELYYANVKRFNTESTGAKVTGILTMTGSLLLPSANFDGVFFVGTVSADPVIRSTSNDQTIYIQTQTGGSIVNNLIISPTSISGTSIKDEDNMASNSASHLATQQSIKAYVDSQILTKDNTDEITEGSSNLYFTNERVDDRVNALVTAGTGITSTYDDAAGTLTLATTITQYTNALARGAISVSGNALSYNSSTGVITSNFEEAPTFTGTVTAASLDISGDVDIDGTTNLDAVDIDGSVHIANSSNPAALLQVDVGDPSVAGSTTVGGILLNGGAAKISITQGASQFGISAGTGGYIYNNQSALGSALGIGTLTNANLVLGTNNAARLTISGSGVATFTGEVEAVSLDISGNADIDGTLETDALTIGGVTSVPFEAADHSKLDGIEASADVTDTANVTSAGALMDSEVTDLAGVKGVTISTLQVKPSEGAFANGDKTKLDGIEASATADQSNAEIRTAVEAASDSNVFTDADHSKLNAIEASATADQTNAEIRTAVEAATDSNVFTDADHTKLNAIEASADVTDTTNVTAAGALMDSELTNLAAVKAINQGLTTSSNVSFGNITTTGYLRGPASFTIDPAAHGDNTGTLVIAGNLQVDGTTTTINSTTVAIDDLNFSIATDAADSAAANGAGITIGGAGATLTYAHADTSWNFNKPLNVTGAITGTSATLTTSGTVLSLDRTGGSTALIELKLGGTVEGYLGATTAKSLVVYNESAAEKFSVSNAGVGTFASTVTWSGGGSANANTAYTYSQVGHLPLAGGTMTGDIILGDNVKLELGAASGGDLQIYHDGTHSYIDGTTTGDLYVRSTSDDVVIQGADDVFIYTQGGEDAIIARGDAGVELFYNTSKKIETTNAGATVTGTLTATEFVGGGAGITGVTGEWDGTHTGTAVITGDLKVTGSSEDLLAIASQSAGSGTIIMSMNAAENAYEPLRFDAETFKVTASGGTSPCIISTAGLNTTFGGTITAAHTLDLTSDGTSAWTNSRVTLNATQANSRGAGIFMHNTVADKEFYAGIPYDSSFDKWMVGYASTASHADSTAAPGNSLFEITSSGNATFAGGVTIEKSTPTLTFNNLAGGGLDPILEASGTNFNIKTSSVTPLSINLSTQAATFAGEVAMRTDQGANNNAILRLRGQNTTNRITRLQLEDYSGALADGLIQFRIPTAGTASSAVLELGVNSAGLTFDHSNNATFAGNILMGNTVVNPASGFSDQTGIGLKHSTTVPEIQVSSDSTALQLGRTATGGSGQIMAMRAASTTVHDFRTTYYSTTGWVDATNYKINGAQGSDGQVLTSTGSGVAWEAATSTDSTKLPLAGGTMTGDITIDKDAARLILQDDSTGNALNQWISYRDNDGTERAYVGYGSTSNSVFYVVNNLSDLKFYAGGVENSTMSGANTTFAGDVSLTAGALSITGDGSNAATLTETGAGILTIATVDALILDSADDITLDAGGNDIRFFQAGTEYGKFKSESGSFTLFSSIQDEDIIFKGNDGGSTVTALTLDMSNAGSATFNDDVDIGKNLNLISASSPSIQIKDTTNNCKLLMYSQNSESIIGTYSAHDLKFFTDSGLTLTLDTSHNATFAGSIVGGSTISAASTIHRGNMTIDSQEIDIGSGDFLLDVAGDITLDAAGDQINFKSNGTSVGYIDMSTGGLILRSLQSDYDMIFQGNDGGSAVNALQLDMSAGGNATFAGDVLLGSSKGLYTNVVQAVSSAGLKLGNDDNSQYIFIKDDTGVGIGTTTPAEKLTVNGNMQLGNAGGGGYLKYNTGNLYIQGTSNIVATFESTGNVGIGTTNPERKLSLYQGDSGSSYAQFINTTTGSNAGDGLLVGIDSAEIAVFWNHENTDMVFATNNDTKLTIAAGGNATFTGDVISPGIYVGSRNASFDFYNNGTTYLNGATTVDAAFTQTGGAASTFSGTVNIHKDSVDGLKISRTSGASENISIGTQAGVNISSTTYPGIIKFHGVNAGEIYTVGASPKLHLGTNSTPRLTIDASGNVGIGDTTPNALLKLESTSTSESTAFFYSNASKSQPSVQIWQDGAGSSGAALLIRNDGSGNALQIDDGSAGNAVFTIGNSGNATFAGAGAFSGNVDINGTAYLYLGGWVRINNPGSGVLKLGQYNGSAWTDTLSITNAGAATFAGTIGSGAITSTGNVTASRLFSGNGGNKTNPMIANGSDEDTGIFFPAANTMAFTAGDTEAFRIAGANATFAGNVTVTGDLTVQGTTVTLDTTNLNVEDKNITLNYGSGDTSSNANGAGITIQDAVNSSTDATILWDATDDKFVFSHSIEHPGITPSTGTSVDQVKEFSMTFQLAANTWTDTGINGTDLATGTYIMQVYVDDYGVNGKHYTEYYSATISWYSTNTNDTGVDEIIVHRAGHAPQDGDVQFRTERTLSADTNDLMLQVKHNQAYNAALDNSGGKSMRFKFRRLI